MNVFRQELKFQFKTFLIWTISLSVLTLLSYNKVDLSNHQSIEMINSMLSEMPLQLQYLLGYHPELNLSRFSDYYLMIYPYIVLAFSFYAITLGAGVISREQLDLTSEFIYVKPMTRSRIIFSKFLANFLLIILASITHLLVVLLLYFKISKQIEQEIVLQLIHIMSLQTIIVIIFYFIGYGLNKFASFKNVHYASLFTLFGLFFFTKLVELTNAPLIGIISPFYVFDPYRNIYLKETSIFGIIVYFLVPFLTIYVTTKHFERCDL